DTARAPGTVDCLNPLKMYQYLACGLPVVSSEWTAIRKLNGPVRLCGTAAEFCTALQRAVAVPGDREAYRRYAAAVDWSHRATTLLLALQEGAVPAELRRAG